MNIKEVIIFCAVAFITQITQSQGQDQRLQACIQKIVDQFDKVKIDEMPSCYDKEKLKEGAKNVEVFQQFYNTLSSRCKRPTKQNIGECLKTIAQHINSKSDEMKAGLINSVHSFLEGGKQCFDEYKHVFVNLDKYVLNGCQEL